MNTNEEVDFLKMSEQEAWLLLLLFLSDKEWEYYQQWKEFENQLTYQNRFYSDHPIVREIHSKRSVATKHISAGFRYYRARLFHEEKYNDVIEYILKASGKQKDEITELMEIIPDHWKEIFVSPQIQSFLHAGSDESIDHSTVLTSAWKKWKRNVRFKGYNKKESTAPPAEIVPNGRVNPTNIRYLYLSEDNLTPVYEIRPMIGQTISIATFKLKRDVVIYDLTAPTFDSCSDSNFDNLSLFNSIGRMFSKPHSGNEREYLPTQFLAEEIKRMGFDGIRFDSSLHSGGVNVVLFNPEDCEAISSDLTEVAEIKIHTRRPRLYEISEQQDTSV